MSGGREVIAKYSPITTALTAIHQWLPRGQRLLACLQVRLHHDTKDIPAAAANLSGHVSTHSDLKRRKE
jgi:hypothetical protein